MTLQLLKKSWIRPGFSRKPSSYAQQHPVIEQGARAVEIIFGGKGMTTRKIKKRKRTLKVLVM